MMKKVLVITLLCVGCILRGQEAAEKEEGPKEGWFTGGTFTFLFNQTAFKNWLAGGQNSIGGNVSANYDLRYLRGNWNWDNKLIVSYGLTKTEDIDLRKTDDRLEFSSLLGKKTSSYWKYSFFLNFRTQLTPGFDYANDSDERFATSGFLRPAYISFGPGMAWEKTKLLKFNLSPATSKITLIGDEVFSYDSSSDIFISSNERETFGVAPGDRLRYELGFFASGYFKFNLMKNVTAENIINLYANYLENPQNVDLNYQLNIAMKINEYLSTNIAFQTIYDDDAFPGFQLREVFGLGLNYSFKP